MTNGEKSIEELRARIRELVAENIKLRDLIYEGPHEGAKHATEAIMQLSKRIAALESALREIAEHPHCDWYPNDDIEVQEHGYGHRCAAEIARKALEGKCSTGRKP